MRSLPMVATTYLQKPRTEKVQAPVTKTTEAKDSQPIYSPDDIAVRWGCCSNTVRSLIRAGHLGGFKVGKRRYGVSADVLRNYEGDGRPTFMNKA